MFKRKANTEEEKQSQPEQYEATASDYKIIGMIGKGAFAKVYGAQCISKQNKVVAIKVIKLEIDDDVYGNDVKPLSISDIQQEAAMMSSLRHRNIVSCFTSFVVSQELWLIMPFVNGGSISYILGTAFKQGIKDEKILCNILKDVLSGLAYMHNQGRIHRDIKSANILIDGESGRAMLADFGVSGALIENGLKKRGTDTQTGTPHYMAPEVMKKLKYNYMADIWSFGITALELAFGTTPYTKFRNAMKITIQICQEKPPTVDSMDKNNKFSGAFKKFISKCLVSEPKKRLSAQELLATGFIGKSTKDKEFMIENFVKYIKKVQIKLIQNPNDEVKGNDINKNDENTEVKDDSSIEKKDSFVYSTSLDIVSTESIGSDPPMESIKEVHDNDNTNDNKNNNKNDNKNDKKETGDTAASNND
eukprot:552321_1